MIKPIWHLDDMTPAQLMRWLRREGACSDAREFCAGKSLKQAWEKCNHRSWIRFLLLRMSPNNYWLASAKWNEIWLNSEYDWNDPEIYRKIIIVKPKKRKS